MFAATDLTAEMKPFEDHDEAFLCPAVFRGFGRRRLADLSSSDSSKDQRSVRVFNALFGFDPLGLNALINFLKERGEVSVNVIDGLGGASSWTFAFNGSSTVTPTLLLVSEGGNGITVRCHSFPLPATVRCTLRRSSVSVSRSTFSKFSFSVSWLDVP